MGKRRRRKLSPRLVLSYAVALGFVVVIGILAAVQLGQISAALDSLTNRLAAEMSRSKEIANQVLSARLSANRYVITQRQADLDGFQQAFIGLTTLLDDSQRRVTAPDRAEMLASIRSAVEAYGEAFGRAVELSRRRQRIQSEVLDVESIVIESKLTGLRIHVISLSDPLTYLALGNAQNASQSMRLNTTKYLENGDSRYAVLFEAGYQQALAALANLDVLLADPGQRQALAEAGAAIEAYHEGFRDIQTDYVELKQLFADRLDVLEPEISDTAQDLVRSVEQEFQSENARAQTLVLQTRLILLITTVMAVLAGLALGITFNRRLAERARAEEALQEAHDRLEIRVRDRTAELQQANEEIRQFAYIVSHDLRAPLVNLKGFAAELRYAMEVLGPATEAGLPHLEESKRRAAALAMEEDFPEALHFIDASVTRMDGFINAVLKLSRLGRRELLLEVLDTEAVVADILDTLAHQIEEHQINVTVGPLPSVTADRVAMGQMIGNLLDNAIKYLDGERQGEISISAVSDDRETTISVRDNGRGIAEEDLPKVFAPFRRVGRQDVPGEGMGLPYVQALVRRHGGRIWCESELGIGTSFSFSIPSAALDGPRGA